LWYRLSVIVLHAYVGLEAVPAQDALDKTMEVKGVV